jgi:hypothetical protein
MYSVPEADNFNQRLEDIRLSWDTLCLTSQLRFFLIVNARKPVKEDSLGVIMYIV